MPKEKAQNDVTLKGSNRFSTQHIIIIIIIIMEDNVPSHVISASRVTQSARDMMKPKTIIKQTIYHNSTCLLADRNVLQESLPENDRNATECTCRLAGVRNSLSQSR